jgi:adenosylcobinamide-phosphate synthase
MMIAMSFFVVLLALLVEQVKPLPRDGAVSSVLSNWFDLVGHNLDAGKPMHAWLVWLVAVLGPTLAGAGVHLLLAAHSLMLAFVFDVIVLYLTLGFRQFSHHFTDIRRAFDRGDDMQARQALGRWKGVDASGLPRADLVAQVIVHALLAAHRHVFGVFFCFVILSALGLGPAGALLYSLSSFAVEHWSRVRPAGSTPVNGALVPQSTRLFSWINHVPARLTASGFAAVGNFEDAIACWRRDCGRWADPNDGVILATASGALDVQLGPAGAAAAALDDRHDASEAAPGMAPTARHLHSVVGLVWRSVVLWMVLVALLTLANVLG